MSASTILPRRVSRVSVSPPPPCFRPRSSASAPALRRVALALLVGFMAVARLGFAATVEGRVQLPKSRTAPVVNQRYEIVTNAGILSTNPPLAVVYLEGDFPRSEHPAVQQMAQKDLAFVPSLLPIEVGTKVEFPNFDSTYHNIFSFSPAKRFDLGRYRSDEKPVPSVLFDVPGLVTLRCDIHEHMRALILVLATPYFVVTEPDGRYRLDHLPVGHYVLKAWVDSRTTREQPVELKDGPAARVDFPGAE